MNKIDSNRITQACNLLIDNNTDISNLLKEGGLLKQLSCRKVSRIRNEQSSRVILPLMLQNTRNGTFQKSLI